MSLLRRTPETPDNHPFSTTSGPFDAPAVSSPATPAPSPAMPASTSVPEPASAVPTPVSSFDTLQTAVPAPSSLVPGAIVTEGTPYQASGRSGPGGVPLLILATLVSGVLVGGIYHFIARFFDLVILFPLIAGLAAGAVMGLAVDKGRVRKPNLVLVCALCAGLLVYGTKLFLNSRQYRGEMIATITQVLGSSGAKSMTAADQAKLASIIDQNMGVWTTFRMYMRTQAAAGVSLKRNGTGSGISIQGPWYWGLLLFEVGLCAAAAGAVAPPKAKNPFCEQTDRWLDEEKILSVNPAQNAHLLEKINTRDWRGLLETPVGGGVDEKTYSNVMLYSAPGSPTATLTIKTTVGANTMPHIHISPQTAESLRALSREIAERPPVPIGEAAPAAGTEL